MHRAARSAQPTSASVGVAASGRACARAHIVATQDDSLLVALLALLFAASLGISSDILGELYTTACRHA